MTKIDEYKEVIKQAAEAVMVEVTPIIQELKTKNEMLERENKFLRELVEKMATPVSDPNTFKVPGTPYNPWEQPYGPVTGANRCLVCGITGINGLVCSDPRCPTRIYATTNTSTE